MPRDTPASPAPPPSAPKRDALHGVTLEAMLTELVAHLGWPGLGARIPVKCFTADPSIASSLRFLRRTPWARAKVETLYKVTRREMTRAARRDAAPAAPTVAPFGSWASPVTADLIVGETIRLGQLAVLHRDIFWTEGRPQEQGRNVLVRCSADGRTQDLTPAPLNARSRVHEYGGGAFALGPKGGFFTHDADQQVWRLRAGEAPRALTAAPTARHADLVIDAPRKRLICVREDHGSGSAEAVNAIVGIRFANGAAQALACGHDFYATPRLSPDGRHLAWLSWDHPNMPWDGTELWLAEVGADGTLGAPAKVAGGTGESVFQPSWSPRGELHFVSDRSGWWNLYRVRDGEVAALHPMAADFGLPQWAFGMSTYGFDARGRIVCTYVTAGRWQLALLDGDTGAFEPIDNPFCSIDGLQVGADFAVFIGASESAPAAVVRLDLSSGDLRTLRASSRAPAPRGCTSVGEAIAFPTEGGLQAHAFFYAPTNRGFRGPEGERPPLLVISHGGPTGATEASFKWPIQYWTSRGFAVVDVNYGGSSGHGRAYRARLDGQWGVVDVDDSINAARFLVSRGDVNAERIAIRGASAGGFTTLCALTFRRFFRAGASHYGIGDLEALATDTHKFESRYLDRLVGPYPQARALYAERSPIHHTERLASPMILFQGTEDRAVPPSQAQAMFDAVDAKGLPVACLMFEGEQHGFRRAQTIKRALEAELYFYGKVFGFTPADAIAPVEIRNLPD
jgi:dipeptidyl aminopeptidase/acylaminoacyl peptidase/uncharacterized protein (DUF2132 family)